jgi:hypothetical protein
MAASKMSGDPSLRPEASLNETLLERRRVAPVSVNYSNPDEGAPGVLAFWGPGISIRCKRRFQLERWIHV